MPPTNDKWAEFTARMVREIGSLNARFDSLDDSHEQLRNGMDARFSQVEKSIDKTNDLLTGNSSPEKGLIVRLDRAEQSLTRYAWTLGTVATAVIGVIVKAIFGSKS